MGNTLPNPHDRLFKALMEDPERAGFLLRESLPRQLTDKMVGDPQPVEGSFIDDNLGGSYSDRLFQVTLKEGRSAFIYTLIEHKSHPDMGVPLQLMGYRQRIWTRYAQDKAELLRKLPPIITLLVYHGAESWNVPTALIDCIDADDDLLALQRDGRYEIRNLTGNAPAYQDLSEHPLLRAGLGAMAWAFIKPFLPEHLATILRDLPDNHPLTRQILIYIVRVQTMAEHHFKQGVAQAKPHLVEALTMSLAQEWMDRGEVKGIHKGEAQTLLRQIARKFGAEAKLQCQHRVYQAEEAQLLVWIDNILAAERLEDVFQDDAPRQ